MNENTSKNKIEYRFAIPDDISTIHDFAVAALKDTVIPGFAKSVGVEMLERIELHPGNIVLAEHIETNKKGEIDREVVGFIEIDATRIKENAFYIRGIYVLSEFRRQGIGKKLLDIILEKKCTRNQQLRAEAYSDFETKFWESLNFKRHHVSLYIEKND
ncbi:MAG: GNAT family N-acetyltransferase [Candidatus Hodarchaeales archaeon]|jgi:ribosomal protein S18 acetylase RimI-like enzyme